MAPDAFAMLVTEASPPAFAGAGAAGAAIGAAAGFSGWSGLSAALSAAAFGVLKLAPPRECIN